MAALDPGQLTAWQRALLDGLIAHPDGIRLALHTGRQNGRASAHRAALAGYLATTGHAHQVSALDQWCVTMTGLGVPLWVRLEPVRRCLADLPSFTLDEPWGGDRAGYVARLFDVPAELISGTPEAEPSPEDTIAAINAALADWENGPDAYRGGG